MKLKFRDDIKILAATDEAGRGPLFGRVYAGACILPNEEFPGIEKIRDSKKYKTEHSRIEAYDFVIDNAISWGVGYEDENFIDTHGIVHAVQSSMHKALKDLYIDMNYIIVDGNYFEPFHDNHDKHVDFSTIEHGDNMFYSIGASSVIAKVEHDKYIHELCERFPELNIYELKKNKGYGTAAHINAINKLGITQFHRKTFEKCKGISKINILK